MALDSLVDSTQLNSDLTDVADAIRAKSGGSSPLAFPVGFVSEIGSIQTGGVGSAEMSVVDVVFDNISRQYVIIPFNMVYDNYAIQYCVTETGVYNDNILVMDNTPSVPTGSNLPMSGLEVKLKDSTSFDGLIGGTSSQVGPMGAAYSVVRGSLSTYGLTADYDIVETNGLRMKSQYWFGKTGYYFKYRATLYGWNNGTVNAPSTINVV